VHRRQNIKTQGRAKWLRFKYLLTEEMEVGFVGIFREENI
jgi:hypothetical protein